VLYYQFYDDRLMVTGRRRYLATSVTWAAEAGLYGVPLSHGQACEGAAAGYHMSAVSSA